jgi:UDP-apiose/xylose synthase
VSNDADPEAGEAAGDLDGRTLGARGAPARRPHPGDGVGRNTGRPARIAVLGAGGFIGSHLVPALARRGCEIDAVDATLAKLGPTGAGVRRLEARIDRPGLLEGLVDRCDAVVSLTALCNPALYNTRPLEVIDANYTDLVPLVKLCTARGRWLIHFSTCEVYGRAGRDGEGRPTARMSEDASALWLGPVHRERWSYACAKQLLERVIFASGRHHGLPFTIVRPFNVIGPRMDFLPDIDGAGLPRVLAAFMSALLRGEDLLLVDGGRQRRSFIFIDDFVDGVVRILERRSAAEGEIFNLGNPANDVTIAELAALLGRAYRAQVPGAAPRTRVVTAEELYGVGYDDSEERVPDIAKAEARLGFRPGTRLPEMLPAIVADYVERYAPLIAARVGPVPG